MINDDELKARMSGLADTTEIDTITLDDVKARSRRRTLQQRGVAVFAAFALVVGGAVGIAALNGGDDDIDVAAEEAETTTDESDGDDAEATAEADTDDAVVTTTTLGPDAMEETTTVEWADTASFDRGYYGPNQIVAWGDGFLAFGERFVEVEPEPIAFDGESPIADYFPPEILEIVQGADIASIEEATAALEEAGLLELATQIVTENPEVLEWYSSLTSGGYSEPFVEYSDDGETWTAVEGFSWPGDQTWTPQVASNGTHLVAVLHDSTWDPETGRPTDVSISVHVTTDLSTWTTADVPVTMPAAPDYVQVDLSPNQIALTDSGWYLSVSSWQYIDLWSVLPTDVQDLMANGEFGWEPSANGVDIVEWDWEAYDEYYAENGDAIEYGPDFEEPGRTVVRTVPWSELPLSYDEWMSAQYESGESQGFVGDFTGGVSTAAAVPGSNEGAQIVATDAGLFALVYDYPEFAATDDGALDEEAAYDYAGPTVTAWFSTDGRSWSEVTLPSLDDSWVDAIVPVDDGILLLVTGNFRGQRYYLGDADGTGFAPVDGPDVPEHVYLWFNTWNSTGDGVAAVVDFGEPNYPQHVAYKASFELDGFQISFSQDGDGNASFSVVDGSGETIFEHTGHVYDEPPFVYGDSGLIIPDADGETIVEIPFEVMENEVYRAESEAWDAAYNDDPYVADFRLVVTRDGRSWSVVELPPVDPEYGWYGDAVVANGTVLLSDGMGGWSVLPLP